MSCNYIQLGYTRHRVRTKVATHLSGLYFNLGWYGKWGAGHNEYKDYILGFIFYKYLSDKETQFAKKEGFTEADIKALSEDDTETVEYIKTNIGYFIAHENLFSTWIEKGKDFGVDDVRVALSAFSRLIHPVHKKLFDGIFQTLDTGLSKLGDSASTQTSEISKLLQLIKAIPMDGRCV